MTRPVSAHRVCLVVRRAREQPTLELFDRPGPDISQIYMRFQEHLARSEPLTGPERFISRWPIRLERELQPMSPAQETWFRTNVMLTGVERSSYERTIESLRRLSLRADPLEELGGAPASPQWVQATTQQAVEWVQRRAQELFGEVEVVDEGVIMDDGQWVRSVLIRLPEEFFEDPDLFQSLHKEFYASLARAVDVVVRDQLSVAITAS